MKVVITQFAQTKLKEIYLYHKIEITLIVVNNIKSTILNNIKLLVNNQKIGAEDEYLKPFKLGHRKLVVGNYKIVYRFTNSIIYITDIFDSRQDPKKQSTN